LQHDLPSPLTSPTLRDDLPRYPVLTQLLLIESIGSTVAGPSGPLYNAVVQQLDTNLLVPRSREACLVADVVGLGLIATYYPGRLAGSFNDLPVYEVVSPALPVGSGTICLPISFFLTTLSWDASGDYIYCLNEYHQNIYILTDPTTKCPISVPGRIFLYKTLFCLGGPNNITTIICETCFTNPLLSGPCSACFYPTGTSSTGVGSGTCVPGSCTYCVDPPYQWLLFPQGFTGVCAFFNNQWTLTQRLPCSWCQTATFLGGTVQAKVCLYITGPGAATLVFTVTQGGVVTSSTYYATFNNGFCCNPLNFVPGPGANDCQCANATNSTCQLCPQSPTSWSVTLGGPNAVGTGAFAIFNNSYVLDTQAGCVWTASNPPAGQTATLTVGIGALGATSFTLVLTGPNGVQETFNFLDQSVDPTCCMPIEMKLNDLSIGTTANPGQPAGTKNHLSCDVNPSCSDLVVMPACPPVITVGPQCCSGAGSGTGSGTCVPGTCSLCTDPQGAPYAWTVRPHGFTGACAAFNGAFNAYYVSPCDWEGMANTDLGTVKVKVIITSGFISVYLLLNGTQEVVAEVAFGGNCCIGYGFGPSSFTSNLCTTVAGVGIEIGPLCCPAGTGTGGGLITGCCPTVTMPSVLHLNFINTEGDCACVAAANPIPLAWDGSMWTWSGDLCGKPTDIYFYCNFGGVSCDDFVFNASTFGAGTPAVCTCSPFRVEYDLIFGEENPCTGNATAVITF
jgi:hypothetical protein